MLIELNDHSPTVTTVQSKSHKSPTCSTNRLYFILNNEPKALNSAYDNCPLPDTYIIPIDDSHNSYHKESLTMAFTRNRSVQTDYLDHEKLFAHKQYQTSSTVKRSSLKTTTSAPRPSRVRRIFLQETFLSLKYIFQIPTLKTRSPITNIQQHSPIVSAGSQKAVSSSITIDKSCRPHLVSSKLAESCRTVSNAKTHLRWKPLIVNKSNTSIAKTGTNNRKAARSNDVQQSAFISDLDGLTFKQQNQKIPKLSAQAPIILPSSIDHSISHALFSKDTVKRVRPVRSDELKLFSCHFTPEISTSTKTKILLQTEGELPPNLAKSSLIPINDDDSTNKESPEKNIDNSESFTNISAAVRNFSEDSLNEHNHIHKLPKQRKFYFRLYRFYYDKLSSNVRIHIYLL